MQKLTNPLLLFYGFLFVASAALKVFPSVEWIVFNIAETGWFPMMANEILGRLLVAAEAILGGMLLFRVFPKTALKLSLAMLIAFCGYLVWMLASGRGDENCGCFGTLLPMTPLESLLKNAVLLAIGFWLNKQSIAQLPKPVMLIFSVPVLLLGVLPFALEPIPYSDESGMNPFPSRPAFQSEVLFTDTLDSAPDSSLKHGKHVVAFLSLKCPHCKFAARKMGIYQKKHSEWSFYFVMNGKKELLADFKKITVTENIPGRLLGKDPFQVLAGVNLPAIQFIEDNRVIGETNYIALDEKMLLTFFGNAK